jgi:hypothetical protein
MSFASVFVGPGTILLEFEAPDTRGETAILWVLVGVGALYLGLAIVRIFVERRDRVRLGRLRDAGIGLILVGGPLAVMAGVAPWTAAAGVWALPAIAFLFDRRLFLPLSWADHEDDGPLLSTQFLNVTLDPDTELLDGDVIRGRLEGRRLSDLSPDEVDALMSEVSSDPDSASILTSIFLQFREDVGQDDDPLKSGAARGRRRAGAGGGRGGERRRTTMDVEEAYSVLGITPGVSETEILTAHRKLMKMVHPDKGGSDYLASKINEARDRLLDR